MFQVMILNVAGVWVPLGKPVENAGDAEERIRRFKQGDRKAERVCEYRITEVGKNEPSSS